MIDLPLLFTQLVAEAQKLRHPNEIANTIILTHDRSPGSGQHDGNSRGLRTEMYIDAPEGSRELSDEEIALGVEPDWGVTISHSDPTGMAALRPSASDRDLRDLEAAVNTFIKMIDSLASASFSGRRPKTWDEAITDARRLVAMEAIEVLERTKQNPKRAIFKAGDAVHQIEQIQNRHCARRATEWESSWTSGLADEECCITHLRLEPPIRKEKVANGLCSSCYSLSKAAAQALNVKPKDAPAPPPSLVADFEKTNNHSGVAWKKLRQSWINQLLSDKKDKVSA